MNFKPEYIALPLSPPPPLPEVLKVIFPGHVTPTFPLQTLGKIMFKNLSRILIVSSFKEYLTIAVVNFTFVAWGKDRKYYHSRECRRGGGERETGEMPADDGDDSVSEYLFPLLPHARTHPSAPSPF